MDKKYDLPPRSPMPEYAKAVIVKNNESLADMIRKAGVEIVVRGLSAGDPEPDVANHALSAMCTLASTALLVCCEKLKERRPEVPLDVVARMIAADVDLRFVTSINIAIQNPPPAPEEIKQ